MDNLLELLKAITLKLSRVLCFCCWEPETTHVHHPSIDQEGCQIEGILSLQNLTIERNDSDDGSIPHVEVPSDVRCFENQLASPSTVVVDDFKLWYQEYCKNIDPILARDYPSTLNAKQCRHLVKKLRYVVDWILKQIHSLDNIEEFKSILKDMRRLVLKAFSLVEECGGENLCNSSIFQLKNEESFRELLLELECCFKAMCVKIKFDDVMNSIDFDMASSEDVQSDEDNFKRILQKAKIASVSNLSTKLANYLLERLEELGDVKGGELNTLKFADCGIFEKGKQLGEGGYGSVYESRWMGLACATKVLNNSKGPCDEETMKNFHIELCILAGLHHPNLVSFMGMGKDDDEWPYLVMEKMDTSVKSLISKYTLEGHDLPPYDVLLDIIQQIASGMYYLHDMHVAHRDLKPDNILWTPLRSKEQPCSSSSSFGYIKLVDFGLSKIEVGSEGFEPDNMGTPIYRAPEVMKRRGEGNANYFQADVYSFGVTCAEILCGKFPFEQQYTFAKDWYEKMKAGLSPILPSSHVELSILISDCCAFDPSERPTFAEIWKRLRAMKINHLVELEGLGSPICSSNKGKALLLKLYFTPKKKMQSSAKDVSITSEGFKAMKNASKYCKIY